MVTKTEYIAPEMSIVSVRQMSLYCASNFSFSEINDNTDYAETDWI